MLSKVRTIFFLFFIYVAFFASGASSLIAEVTWNRMLIVVVGNSMSAAAMIVAIFMGGLGLGSYVGGKVFARRRASILPYVVLEVCIGVFVLLSPQLFDLLSAFFMAMAENVDDRGWLAPARLVVTMGALLLPASLMGATFPAIISGVAPDSAAKRSARTGYLYSINTLGAAIGCFFAGYHLLFEFGVRFTLNCAFGLYLAASLSALLAFALRDRSLERTSTGDTSPAPVPVTPRGNDGLRRPLNVATFGIGFAVLGYEVILTRLGILYLGNTASIFPLVLTAFLLGTGISAVAGTWLYGIMHRHTGWSHYLFGGLAMASGVFVVVVPYLLLTDWVLSVSEFARAVDTGTKNPLLVLGIIMAPTTLIGGLLPIAIRMLQPQGKGEATREAATLYALNTCGGLLGAGVANHYLVPLIGTHGVITLLSLIFLAVGLFFLFPPGRSLSRRALLGAGLAIIALVLTAGLPNMVDLYAAKIAEGTGAQEAEIQLIHEGRAATVTVLDQRDPRKGTYRDMYLNGVEEASTRYWHVQLFKLLGALPVLIHESEKPKDTLVIAFGAGITAGSVLASDSVGSLDVVDLNPDIEGINNLFTHVNGDVFHKPRFHFHNDDGRNYLVTSNKKYDVIISDSTHPRAYDSWILYTEEFYRDVKKHLAPGGIFAQWVPIRGSMEGDLMRIHLNTWRTVFPHSTLWYVYGSDQAFLLATPRPFSLEPQRLQSQLDRLPEWFGAEEYQIGTVPQVAGFFWLDDKSMTAMIGGETRINTDHQHYFDKQSAIWPSHPSRRLPQYQASILPFLGRNSEQLHSEIRINQAVARYLSFYDFYGNKPALYRAFCIDPENGNVRYHLSKEIPENLPDFEAVCRPGG